jgi:uncharacterized protein
VSGAPQPIRVIDPEWIPLSDGTRQCARIWLPETAGEEPVPGILEYLPYRRNDAHAASDSRVHPYFAAHGYASVRVDLRGSGDSDGLLSDEYSRQEHDDALEVIAWIAAQPWCTGAVGMTGISWSGFNSLQVAARRPPALRAIITACSTDDRYDNDVHYMGGVPLACYLLRWATALTSFNARPPDPRIVGDRWRDMWLARLDGNVELIRLWLEHQSRDDYWRHGSICEDYSAITCPVFAVGGWADAYVDSIFRMLEHLSCPRLGLVGPWGHMWPHEGRPGPAIGYLQEALRWWDHWLKGEDTGIMDEPMLRAWLQEPVAPAPDYDTRPGRWVGEPSIPRTGQERRLVLDDEGLLEQSSGAGSLSHSSELTVGLDGGSWCPYGNPADLPLDQRRDDAASLSFDSAPLDARIELLGSPALRLRIASDRPTAFVAARLCDVAPDGSSTVITRGVMNLCHHAGRANPQPLEPGVPIDVSIALKNVGYAVPAGHRIRLAISTSYWPWLWPSPERVTITVHTGGASELRLPVRARRPEDDRLRTFEPPDFPPELPVVQLRERRPDTVITREVASGTVSVNWRRDFGARRFPSGIEYLEEDPMVLTIREGDPLSAEVSCHRRIELRRGDWRTHVELRSTMTGDATDYRVSTVIDAYEGDTCVHRRAFVSTIPRNCT